MLTAWGDESQSNSTLDPGTYILAVALATDEDLEMIRESMLKLQQPSARKVRWHDGNDARRQRSIDAIAELPLTGLIVVHSASDDGAERGRRKCLARLLAELPKECESLTLESRGRADDRRDLQMMQYLRWQHPDHRVKLTHEVGPAQPLLWVADTLCGAVVQDRCGKPASLERLRKHITVTVMDASL